MKKFISLIVIVLITAVMILYKSNATEAAKSSLDGPRSKYGYKLSVLSYDGTGEPKVVSTNGPVLVYQEGLLDEVTITFGGDYPHGTDGVKYNVGGQEMTPYEMFMTNKYDVEQYIEPNNPDTNVVVQIANGTGLDKETYKCENNQKVDTTIYSSSEDLVVLPPYFTTNYDLSVSIGKPKDGVASEISKDSTIKGCPVSSTETEVTCGDFPVDNTGSIKRIFRYDTDERMITFPGGRNIGNINEYYKIIPGSGTPYEIVEKYASLNISPNDKNKTVLEDTFGIILDRMKLNTYYVQVEVVQREFDENTIIGKEERYVAKELTNNNKTNKPEIKPTRWDAGGIYINDAEPPKPWIKMYECTDGEDTKHVKIKGLCFKCYNGYSFDRDNNQCYKWINGNPFLTPSDDLPPADQYQCDKNVDSNGMVKCWSHTKETRSTYEVTDRNCFVAPNVECKPGEVYSLLFYGKKGTGISRIVPSRTYTGTNNFKAAARNTCNDPLNQEKVFNENGKATGEVLYYVGPNLEKALVGPKTVDQSAKGLKNKSYKYYLNDAKWTGTKYECNKNDEPEQGIQHFYLLDNPGNNNCTGSNCVPLCERECSKYADNKTSENYLNCAEQYAEGLVDYDAGYNPRNRKYNIIINECGFNYGRSPSDGSFYTKPDRESQDSCNNSTKFGIAATYKNNILNLESKCNVANGKYVPDQKAISVQSCQGDGITDFDYKNGKRDDSNDKPFSLRTYINKVCKETTDFDFKDTSQLKLSKGSGFTYPIVQEGEKDCTYFFNLEQWKVDYASAPERDPELRKRMMDILEVFNKEITNSASKKSSDYVTDFISDGYGKTNFTSEGYNFGGTTISTNVGENIIGKEKADNIVQGTNIGKTSTNSAIKSNKENKTSARLQTVAIDTVYVIEKGKISTKKVNRYKSIGEGEITYTLDKVCISTDGLASVYKSPTSEVCYERQVDGKTKEVLAESKYYTSFKIDPGKDNTVTAKVNVGTSTYNEKCTYKINDNGSCKLIVTPKSNNGIKIGNGQYKDTQLDVSIRFDIGTSQISSVSITDNGVKTNAESITITKQNNRSVTVHRLVGTVTLKDGTTRTCEEVIDQYSTPSCNISCSIKPVNGSNTIFEIESTGKTTAKKYYSYTSNHMTPAYDLLYKNNNAPYDFMKNLISPAGYKEKYYIRLGEPLKDGKILYGYVTAGDGCNNYCQLTGDSGYPNPNDNDCTKIYKPTETEDIHNYCISNWTEDVNGYKDEEDCEKKCTISCPNDRENYDVVKNFCKDAKLRGYPSENMCMNVCFSGTGDTGIYTDKKYIFRSVNVLDPFPNSQESPFDKGNRIVGKNWQFLSEYITNDSDDTTSITGDNKNNNKVEYIIDLSASDIRRIRHNTSINGKESKDLISGRSRSVYSRLDRVTTKSKDMIQEYKSEFLHNSEFIDVFVPNHGKVNSTFTP